MAFSTFVKIDGLVDDSVVAGHVGEIEVYSFSWGASSPTPPLGATGAGKVSISSFNVMKKADQVSPSLFLACAKGTHYKTATVTMVKPTGSPAGGAGTAPFIEYDFSDVVVESIQWSGSSGGDDTPTESVSLVFTRVVYKSNTQSPTGSAVTSQAGWDLVANKQA
jgi:type VI secretion system secreted protein Hcp